MRGGSALHRLSARPGLIACCLAVAWLTACAAPPPSNHVALRVAPRLSSFVAYLAADGGYFDAAGLDVELIPFDSPSMVIPSLAQGDIDVSTIWGLDPAYINLIARGARLRLVAGGIVHAPGDCGYSSFLARPELIDSGRLDQPSGLRGLRITTERTATNYYAWSRLLAQAGLTMKDVELVDVPSSGRMEAFSRQLVDLSSITEPWRTRLVRSGHARFWRPVSDVLPNAQVSFVVFGGRLLDQRRDLGVRFLEAYQRAVRDYVEQGRTDRLIEIVAKRTRIDPEELREMCWPSFTPDGMVDRASIEEFQRWALAEGLIDVALPLETLFDSDFLRQAAADSPG